MSIINQMLKDIDQRDRHAHPGGRANYVYSGRSLRSRRWLWALSGVAVVVVLLIALWGASLFLTDNDSVPVPTADQLRIERISTNLEARSIALEETEQRLEEREQELAARAAEVSAAQRNQAATRARAQSLAVPVVASEDSAESSSSENVPSENASPASTADQQNVSISSEGATAADANLAPVVAPEEVSADAGEMSIQRSDSRSASAPALHRRGLEALESGDARQAMQRFQEALLVSPEHHDSRLQLAALQFGRGFAADALELLRDGLQLAPENTEFLLLKARIYDRIEQPAFALELLRDVSARLPQDADILLMRASLATDAGDYALAVASYRQLVAWRSDQGSWWLGYGYALEQFAQAQEQRGAEYASLRESASEAYRRALQDARLSISGQEFALDRREALSN